MNPKTHKRLRRSILLFAIGILIYTALVVVLNRVMRIPVTGITDCRQQVSGIAADLHRLQSLKDAYLLEYRPEGIAMGYAGEVAASEFDLVADRILRETGMLENRAQIRRDTALATKIRNLSEQLTEAIDQTEFLFLTFREMGNAQSGLTAQWLGLSDQLLMLSDDNGMEDPIENLKRLEINYLQKKDPRLLNNILTISNDLFSVLPEDEADLYINPLNDYIALTKRMADALMRISQLGNAEAGQQAGIFVPALNGLEEIDAGLEEKEDRTGFLLNVIFYLLLAGLFLLTAWSLFNRSQKLILEPLEQTLKYTGEVVQGKIPVNPLAVRPENEFSQLAGSINDFVHNLREKIAFVKGLNVNDFHVELTENNTEDPLGSELLAMKMKIIDTTDEQKRNNEENMRRRYINEGLAKFAAVLSVHNTDLKTLGDNFIQHTVKYLNAIQGGLFLLNEENDKPLLKLIAAFAYDRKKYLEKTLEMGEGLIGTCAVEKNTINLTEIPKGYISITSGLGDTPPDNLLLVPIIHDGEILGVMEVASLKKFQDFEIKFAEDVAQNLASTIVYARNSERTSLLLKKSQEQAQEMAEQEEEMRQNMEELKATQEESTRREEEYRGRAEAIEKAMIVAEYDNTGTIIQANEHLCMFLGLPSKDIVGKAHQEIFKGQLTTDEAFWKDVEEKTTRTETETITIGKKKEKIREQFTAVFNNSGALVRYINFAVKV